MIPRSAVAKVEVVLDLWPSAGLYGPRQVGKSTIARQIAAARGKDAVWLNLREQVDRDRFEDHATFFAEHGGKLVVLDEIHHMGRAFDILHARLDDQALGGADRGQFLFLGSASHEVRAKAARSLGARAQSVFLGPIQPDELPKPKLADLMEVPDPLELTIDAVEPIGTPNDTIALEQLWLRGGLPPSLLADDASSFQWRRGYLSDLFELPAGASQFRACLEKIGANQGRLMSLQKETKAFATGLDLLDRMGLVRRLRPWFKNTDARLTKTPKFYIRDSGLLHALNNCRGLANVRAVEHLVGASWEGFCIEAIAAVVGESADLSFYRTDDGAEADLVIEFSPTEAWVIEIKLNPDATIRPGFNAACAMVKPSKRLVVHGGEAAFVDRNGLEALPLNAFLARLTDHN